MNSKEAEKISIIRPVSVDLFYAGSGGETHLPDELATHPRLLTQAAQRRDLYDRLGRLFRLVPDVNMEMSDAVERGLVSAYEVREIYQGLADFLHTDPNNSRLLLYLPFSFLPSAKKQPLAGLEREFTESYLQAWRRLLGEDDVRANFIDGDIPEEELGLGLPPVVRKAAHLTPKLVEKGLITEAVVIRWAYGSHDHILRQSMEESLSLMGRKKVSEERVETPWRGFDQLASDIENQLFLIEERYQEDVKRLPIERADWEKKDRKNQAFHGFAREVADVLKTGGISPKDLETFCQNDDFAQVGIYGLTRAQEELSSTNQALAKRVLTASKPLLVRLWQEGSLEVKEAIAVGCYHLVDLQVVDEDFLGQFGLNSPHLDELLPVNLDFLKGQKLVRAPQLYPVNLFFGSRLKGYALFEADLDRGVFVRPEVRWGDRDQIGGLDKVTEFWLEKRESGLGVRSVPLINNTIAESDWVHLILGGVWLGENEGLQEVLSGLSTTYLQRAGGERSYFLRQIEREVLQYRFLHKGYRRLYARREDQTFAGSTLKDFQTDLWDPGFRRVATRLFISKVFLPDLS